MNLLYRCITLFTVIAFISFSTNIYVQSEEVKPKDPLDGVLDGVYEGTYSFIRVAVTIENGRIVDIKIQEHGGGGEEYASKIEPLISVIIQRQSTRVDSMAGATLSSENLKKAIEDALSKRLDRLDISIAARAFMASRFKTDIGDLSCEDIRISENFAKAVITHKGKKKTVILHKEDLFWHADRVEGEEKEKPLQLNLGIKPQ